MSTNGPGTSERVETGAPSSAAVAGIGSPNSFAAVSLVLVGSLVVLSTAVIAPALPAIEAHFQTDPRASYLVPLLVTIPALVIAIAAPFAGFVLDRFGRQRAMLAALIGFVLFGAAGSMGNSLDWLLWTRAGLGLCVAFLTAGFTSLVGDLFSSAQRATLLGRQVSLNAVVGLSMLIAGGLLTEWHWRGMFLIYLAAAPLVVMFARSVPHAPMQSAARADESAAGDAQRANWLAIVTVYALAMLCMLFALLAATRTPFLMQELYAASAVTIAVIMAAFTVGMLPAAATFARLRGIFSPQLLFAAGFAFMAAGYGLQGIAPGLVVLGLAVGVVGFGFGLLMPNLSTTLLVVAPAALRGRLSGGLASALFLGQFLSPIFSQPLVQRFGIQTGFLIAAAMMVAVAVGCLIWAAGRFGNGD